MKKLVVLLLFVTGVAILISNCSSNKSSKEACLHDTTMNLDSGKYDKVLQSDCATPMQKGAANFGQAGFSFWKVMKSFTKSDVSSGTTNTQSDLSKYMTTLIGKASSSSLSYMDKAVVEYKQVLPTDADNYTSAQFYIGLVEGVRGLSLMNMVLPNLLGPDGTINNACDKNANNVNDEVDATACSLMAATQISVLSQPTPSCANMGANVVATGDMTLKDAAGQPVSGTYKGLTITMTGSGNADACMPTPNTITYYRLLYKDSLGKYWSATTTSDICTSPDSKTWPCPVMQDSGTPLDLVSAIDTSLTTAIDSLGIALPVSSSTGTVDVQQTITDIKANACPTGVCTSADISTYLQTNLK